MLYPLQVIVGIADEDRTNFRHIGVLGGLMRTPLKTHLHFPAATRHNAQLFSIRAPRDLRTLSKKGFAMLRLFSTGRLTAVLWASTVALATLATCGCGDTPPQRDGSAEPATSDSDENTAETGDNQSSTVSGEENMHGGESNGGGTTKAYTSTLEGDSGEPVQDAADQPPPVFPNFPPENESTDEAE